MSYAARCRLASIVLAASLQTTLLLTAGEPASVVAGLPVLTRPLAAPPPTDFLLDPSGAVAKAYRDNEGRELILDNGLVRRTWRIQPDGACVGFDNLMTGLTMLRSVRPEARIDVDGVSYEVGGLAGQSNHAFLAADGLNQLTADDRAWRLVGIEIGKPVERFAWRRIRRHAPDARWPPPGIAVRFDYAPRAPQAAPPNPSPVDADDDGPEDAAQSAPPRARVSIHYELYDGLPAMSKWLTVTNEGDSRFTIDRFVLEELAAVEQTSWVEGTESILPRPDYLHVETDFAFGGFNWQAANRHIVHWRPDPLYATQVNYGRQTPCLLQVSPDVGPSQDVAPGETFTSCRAFELAYDSSDRERRGLTLRRLYRTIAPWVTENPLTHHLLLSDPKAVRRAVDEAAAVGFECIILSFGSGYNMESTDSAYLQQWKDVAEYAAQRGIEIGGYSLFSSRRIGGGNDIVSPPGKQPMHGNCPAATSPWGVNYYRTLRETLQQTAFRLFENDGPYPGDVDVTPRPPYQKGELDSQWAQWRIVVDFYRWCCAHGVYVNAPDYYYLNGTNKCGMGYRETNWSLPRDEQVLHTRQNIYDGVWEKTPSMGWMFIPLAQYHGGGPAATVEPLREHLDHYERMIASNLGMGVQAHFRGPRLFDAPETKELVARWTDWYKRHRDVLESDIVHGRRADGRDVDWILHVHPQGDPKGMVVVYNPLAQSARRTLRVNAYYTGLEGTAKVSHAGQAEFELPLAADRSLDLDVDVPPRGMTWYTLR